MPIVTVKFDADDKEFTQKLNRIKKSIAELDDDRPGNFLASFDVSNLPGALRQISTLQGSIGALGSMGLAGGIAAAGLQFGEMAWELGLAGAEALRTEASFERLAAGAGTSGQAMLQAMRTASHGTITNADLMAAANRALVLGVADSAEEMAALTEAAILRGRDVGVGATQAVNDLVTGIGRMSPETLDNLGIVGAQQTIEAYAASLGKTAQQLTEVEKKQALVNATLDSVAGRSLVADDAAAIERMNVSIANAQEAAGKLFSPAVATGADALAGSINEVMNPDTTDQMAQSVQLLGVYFGAAATGIGAIAAATGDGIGALGDQWQQAFNPTARSVADLTAELGTMQQRLSAMQSVHADQVFKEETQAAQASQVAIDQLTGRIAIFEQALGAKSAASQQAAAGVQALTGATAQLAAAESQAVPAVDAVTQRLIAQAQTIASVQNSQSAGLRSQLLGMAGDLGSGTALAQYKELNAKLDARTLRMRTWGYTAEQIEFANAAWIENTTGKLREQATALTAVGTAASSAGGAVGSMQNDLQSSIASMVSGQVQGALSLDVAWPGKDGAGGDGVNENAKRLAAIANEGLIGQDWLGQFAQEAPGTYADLMLKIAEGMDARGAAQLLMGEFQAGLRPDLLNFDMIKQQVKDQLTSQQTIQEMTPA